MSIYKVSEKILSITTATTHRKRTIGTTGTIKIFQIMLSRFVSPVKKIKTGKTPRPAPSDGIVYALKSLIVFFFGCRFSVFSASKTIPASAEKLNKNHKSKRSNRGFRISILTHATHSNLHIDTTLPQIKANNPMHHIITALTTLLSNPQSNA